MARPFQQIDSDTLLAYASEYIKYCEDYTIQQATAKGVVNIKSRKVPTFKYFVLFWLQNKDKDFYTRQHFHKVLKWDEHPLNDTLKKIEEAFKMYAVDVVANEGKGIFYAKNYLGMTDKQQIDATQNVRVINIDPLADGE